MAKLDRLWLGVDKALGRVYTFLPASVLESYTDQGGHCCRDEGVHSLFCLIPFLIFWCRQGSI